MTLGLKVVGLDSVIVVVLRNREERRRGKARPRYLYSNKMTRTFLASAGLRQGRDQKNGWKGITISHKSPYVLYSTFTVPQGHACGLGTWFLIPPLYGILGGCEHLSGIFSGTMYMYMYVMEHTDKLFPSILGTVICLSSNKTSVDRHP